MKLRPALLLAKMPPFGDFLVCGISTQLHQEAEGFDEVMDTAEPDFSGSGLKAASVIRLGFLAVLPAQQFRGAIGRVAPERWKRLRHRLADFLQVGNAGKVG